MATDARKRTKAPQPGVTVLHGVPFRAYARMTRLDANRHLRMAYHDGTLEIMSPKLRMHDRPARRLGVIVVTLCDHLGIGFDGTSSATFHRAGDGAFKGHGKEPDESFYITNLHRLPLDRDPDLNAGDPPPDLWIEVDNRASSLAKLPTYAVLGVPEVWRYRASRKTLEFLQLVGKSYQSVDQSLCLPMLTPALVLDALSLGEDLFESNWMPFLREWTTRIAGPRPG